jgi:hypothetical protein
MPASLRVARILAADCRQRITVEHLPLLRSLCGSPGSVPLGNAAKLGDTCWRRPEITRRPGVGTMLAMSPQKSSDPMLHQPGVRCLAMGWAVLASASLGSLPAQATQPSAKEAAVALDPTLPHGVEVWTDARRADRTQGPYRPRSASATAAAGAASGQPFGAGYEARMARGLPVGVGGSAVPAGAPRPSGSARDGCQTPAGPGTVRPLGADRGR